MLFSVYFHFVFTEFDGERIPHLDKMRNYKQPTQPDRSNEEDDEMNNYVLNKLFKKTGGLYYMCIISDSKWLNVVYGIKMFFC